MSKPNIFSPDWIQTIAVVTALCVAFWELYINSDAPKLEKAQNTVELLREGYDDSVLTSLNAFVRGPNALMKETEGNFTQALVDLTPYHEYLVAFAICYDTGLCLEEESLTFLCPRLKYYEDTIPLVFKLYNKDLPAKRPLQNTKAWQACGYSKPPAQSHD